MAKKIKRTGAPAAKGRAKTTAKVARRAEPAPVAERSRIAGALTALRYIIPSIVAIAILIGVVFGLPKLREQSSYRMRYEDGVSIFVDLPVDEPGDRSWLKDEFATELHRIAAEQISANPDVLSRKQLDAVRIAMARTGWFEGDPIVRRKRGQIHISGDWRVPAAVVRYEGVEYLISWRGQLLPKTYAEGEAFASDQVRVISGVTFGPPADDGLRLNYGSRWQGGDVRAALELLALLQNEPFGDDIAGIHVERRDAAGQPDRQELTLSIMTADETRVVWGCSPQESGVHRGEVSREKKLENLRELHARFGRIDAGRKIVEVFRHNVGFESSEGGP